MTARLAADVTLKLSGRERNLPGHVVGHMLENGAGEDVALVTETAGAAVTAEDNGLTLALRLSIPAHGEKTIWIELPYEWPVARNGELSRETGEALLAKAVAQWDDLWAHGTKVDFPQKELTDFYYSSIAYVLILTEFDARGDLWALDGPAVYRQYWGRGEYFQARAMEVAGFMTARARERGACLPRNQRRRRVGFSSHQRLARVGQLRRQRRSGLGLLSFLARQAVARAGVSRSASLRRVDSRSSRRVHA